MYLFIYASFSFEETNAKILICLLKMRATGYSETFVSIHRTTHNQVPNVLYFLFV